MKKIISLLLTLSFTFPACVSSSASKKPPSWVHSLGKSIRALEKGFHGEFGVYILDIEANQFFSYKGSEYWYLSSTVKVPVAIALLQMVDDKKISLKDKVVVRKSDYRDGGGPVNWIEPGNKVSYKYLLNQMLIYSDNAATDLIIRRVGLDKVNKVVDDFSIKNEFGKITTLLDVRKKAYSEIHPSAKKLSNMDFFAIKKQRQPKRKIAHLAKLLKLKEKDLVVPDLTSGFSRYYEKKWNSATLVSYAELLKNLVKQKTLSPESTKLLLKTMAGVQTGKKRIRKGLPQDIIFAHKTGTQHKRACDVGVARGRKTKKAKALILVCTRNWRKLSEAENLMARVGQLISKSNLLNSTQP